MPSAVRRGRQAGDLIRLATAVLPMHLYVQSEKGRGLIHGGDPRHGLATYAAWTPRLPQQTEPAESWRGRTRDQLVASAEELEEGAKGEREVVLELAEQHAPGAPALAFLFRSRFLRELRLCLFGNGVLAPICRRRFWKSRLSLQGAEREQRRVGSHLHARRYRPRRRVRSILALLLPVSRLMSRIGSMRVRAPSHSFFLVGAATRERAERGGYLSPVHKVGDFSFSSKTGVYCLVRKPGFNCIYPTPIRTSPYAKILIKFGFYDLHIH